MDYRIAFADADWEPALDGTARLKRIERGGKVLRLVEMTPTSVHRHWCEVGHVGMVLDGDLEIEFDVGKTIYRGGDALFIPHGAQDRHRPRALSDRVLMFLVEDEAP